MIEIKQVITDVDGCLTDGGVYYFDDGRRARKFSTFDGAGFSLLHERGIQTILITSSGAEEIHWRAKWLKVNHINLNVIDKAHFIEVVYPQFLDTAAYFGNDMNDYDAMKLCAFSACPADAHDQIYGHCSVRSQENSPSIVGEHSSVSGYVCKRNGGQGAFREFADMLISNHFKFRSRREIQEIYHKMRTGEH